MIEDLIEYLFAHLDSFITILDLFILNNIWQIPVVCLIIFFSTLFIVYIFKKLSPSKEKLEKLIEEKSIQLKTELDSMSRKEKEEFFLNDPRASVFYKIYHLEDLSKENVRLALDKLLSLPNEEIAREKAKRVVGAKVINCYFWLPLFFTVIPLLWLLFWIFFRWIQIFILTLNKSNFLFVENWGSFGLAIAIFTFLIGGGMLEPLVGRNFVLQRWGKDYYYKIYNVGLGKKAAYFLIKLSLLILPVIFLCVFHYLKIGEKGIYINRWLSLKEQYYSWEDVEEIYLEEGRILRWKDKPEIYSNKKDEYRYPFVILLMQDGSKIEFDPYGNMVEIYRKRSEAINFVVRKTGLPVERKIYNVNNNQYIDLPLHDGAE